MIASLLHDGSGLGDQLFRYITVRSLAEKNGYEWGMVGRKNFKGDSFMPLDMGKENPKIGVHYFNPTLNTFAGDLPNEPEIVMGFWQEKDVRDEFGNDTRSYDPEINFVEDNTLIDGSFEDDKYWRHNLDNISKWLAVEPLNVPDTTCIIGFRGGEYYADPKLGLPKEYFDEATELMRNSIENVRFEVHTDDPDMAEKFFPDFIVVDNKPISHSKHSNMGFNWRSARYAKYAIIPNSAFFILPRILKHHEDPDAITIAPRYWARRNTKTWARPACYYPEFLYL